MLNEFLKSKRISNTAKQSPFESAFCLFYFQLHRKILGGLYFTGFFFFLMLTAIIVFLAVDKGNVFVSLAYTQL